MKKAVTALLVLALLGGGYLTVAHISGGAYETFGLHHGGDRGELRRVALQFLEDIQFKDFASAASYHAPDLRDSVDIPFLIQRLFTVKRSTSWTTRSSSRRSIRAGSGPESSCA